MRRINSSTHCVPTNIVTCEVNADNAPLSCLCLSDTLDSATSWTVWVCVTTEALRPDWSPETKTKYRLGYAVVCSLEAGEKGVIVKPLAVK